MEGRHFAILFVLFIAISFYVMGWQTADLVYYGFRSFLRMAASYVISIISMVVLALLITHNRRLSALLFPILDVLQAVPVLGFLPFAILFFVHVFPGGIVGQELSSVFLIVTGMAWALGFAIIESINYITGDMRDLAKMLDLRGFRYLTELVFPAALPQFVSSSMTAWGGGWYFLVASEYISMGTENIQLPGLGSFIAQSAFSYNMAHSLIGLAMLAFIVFGMNIFMWQPLLKKSRGQLEKSEENFVVRLLERIYGAFGSLARRFQGRSVRLMESLSIGPDYSWKGAGQNVEKFSYVLLAGVFLLFGYILVFRLPEYLKNGLILQYMFASVARMIAGYAIALVWTCLVAIFLARNKKAMGALMPFFDLGQSIPAISVFPIVVIVVVQTIGGQIGLNVASILLLLTGMQWYFLFNLIRAVQTIPEEIFDLSAILSLKSADKLRHIMVPALLPAIFIASVESLGGGWNASIVSEYIVGPNGQPFQMPGLGYLLSSSSAAANMDGILLAVSSIMIIVLTLNYLVWKPLIRGSDRYKF